MGDDDEMDDSDEEMEVDDEEMDAFARAFFGNFDDEEESGPEEKEVEQKEHLWVTRSSHSRYSLQITMKSLQAGCRPSMFTAATKEK